ncbi:MAG TPA: hypothetical protein VHC22_27315 [Pirellulales bacterium]|nr:hypothetical protein [Pirellulales bacterium]
MNENPYASPAEFSDDPVASVVNRPPREELAEAVEDFLSDRIGAFEFDERLRKICDETPDHTVQIVAEQLWCFYDDITDHPAVLTKEEWNLIQRLMLIVRSGGELEQSDRRVTHASQGVALATLVATGSVSFAIPQAWPLFVFLAGLISIGLSWWREHRLYLCLKPDPWCMWPFPSFAAISRALQRAPDFRKKKWRPELAKRHIRSADSLFALRLPGWVGWCLASPIALAAQCFPLRSETLMLVESS